MLWAMRLEELPGVPDRNLQSLGLDAVRAAQAALAGRVRLTPVLRAEPVQHRLCESALWLKLECLQIAGSFKSRGALHTVLSASAEQRARGLYTASGGNHGLGIAYAGWLTKTPTTVFLPHSTPQAKRDAIVAWGAQIVVEGEVWDDADRAARRAATAAGALYVHPFDDVRVVAGQGTVGLEIVEQLPDVDVVVVAIGGGGLVSGVALAVHALRPGVRIIGVEPVGAPTLHDSVRAGRLVELERVQTAAGTLAPRQSAAMNLALVARHVERIVLVTDDQMRDAARWLWRELQVAAELSGSAAVAAIQSGLIPLAPHEKVCAIVCGAGTDGMSAPGPR